MKYISERITNISELEALSEEAYIGIQVLRKETEKDNPSMEVIEELSKALHLNILKIKDFEFCLEAREITTQG